MCGSTALGSGRRPEESDSSASAVADADLRSFDDDGNRAFPLRDLQHLIEPRAILDHVVILDLVSLGLVRLTGGRGIGSGVLSKDAYDVGHGRLPFSLLLAKGVVSRGGLEPPTR